MTKKNTAEQIRTMEVGETIAFPSDKLRSVRTYASEIGFMLGRKYKCTTDRENMKIIIKRES